MPLPYNAGRFMRHILSVLVENKFGALTRISGLFSGRGFNIDTLNVAPTQDPTQSRMTIVVKGDDSVLDHRRAVGRRLAGISHGSELVSAAAAIILLPVRRAAAETQTTQTAPEQPLQ